MATAPAFTLSMTAKNVATLPMIQSIAELKMAFTLPHKRRTWGDSMAELGYRKAAVYAKPLTED